MVISRDQGAGRIHNIRTENSFFKRVEQFKYLGANLTNQNSIQGEVKSKLKSRSASYHSVQNVLHSSLLSKDKKIEIYKIIILPAVLYGYANWSLTLREERRLKVSENRMVRTIFGPEFEVNWGVEKST